MKRRYSCTLPSARVLILGFMAQNIINALMHALTSVTKQVFLSIFPFKVFRAWSKQHNRLLFTSKSLIMAIPGRIVVFSIIGCPHCMKAKNTLQEKSLPYTDIGLDKFPQCREKLKARTGKHTVPQIFFNGIYVGGNEDLQKAVGRNTYVMT